MNESSVATRSVAVNRRDEDESTKAHAKLLDVQDPLAHFRQEFIIPTRADLKRKTLAKFSEEDSEECIYLCGNSLGLQPRRTKDRIEAFLTQWSTKAVTGHFVEHEDSPLAPFLHIDDHAAKLMAPVVGAMESEVAVMGQLTANLLLMMSSFYRPSKEKCKIILEGKAFPSDHYAIESQIQLHGFDPKEAMVLIKPDEHKGTISTEHILKTITKHASETALILLPGIQFYTGQYFDMPTITKYAHSKGIKIGWDCAHAVGNIDLKLHEWDVDFAVWCNYKYLNSGPGAIAGIFVHEKHGKINSDAKERYRPRLCGWWGADKATRFQMDSKFVPRPGAAGYQLSNPSALDLSAVIASLEIFGATSMTELRQKSVSLTKYLEKLLLQAYNSEYPKPFAIITPTNIDERGAQLSLRLQPGLLENILHSLEESGVVVDERKPDVIRVAPTPLYNTYLDVWNFVQVFFEACRKAVEGRDTNANGTGRNAGDESRTSGAAESVWAKDQARGAKSYGPNDE